MFEPQAASPVNNVLAVVEAHPEWISSDQLLRVAHGSGAHIWSLQNGYEVEFTPSQLMAFAHAIRALS